MIRAHSSLSPREGGTLNCAPSADAVAGNGRPLSYSLRSPSADAVAGGGDMGAYVAFTVHIAGEYP
jgi:hypothetical protein